VNYLVNEWQFVDKGLKAVRLRYRLFVKHLLAIVLGGTRGVLVGVPHVGLG
jgi:hypothetical protein